MADSADHVPASAREFATTHWSNVVTLSVEATGTPPLSYQWRRQSSNVAGQTSDALVIASLQNSNAGNYTVVRSLHVGNLATF